jgi:mycoredoxin
MRNDEGATSMSATITMYSTTWCGYCNRLKKQLDREGIGYTEINIEQDPASADFVEKVNNGNQVVPTVLVVPASGEQVVMTNPSLAQVKQAMGV